MLRARTGTVNITDLSLGARLGSDTGVWTVHQKQRVDTRKSLLGVVAVRLV